MSLDQLIEEIRSRVAAEVAKERARGDVQGQRLLAERDARIAEIRDRTERRATREIEQERAQKLAGARLQARKLVYEAKEQNMERSLGETRKLLAEYTRTKEYPQLLKRMYQAATSVLGTPLRVSGRKEDQTALEAAAGKAAAKTPVLILGGLIAETTNGERRLDLSFDELLRLREDRVRTILAS